MSSLTIGIILFCIGDILGVPLSSFYPFGEHYVDSRISENDDALNNETRIGTPFPFFNFTHESLYVNTNGDISFVSGLESFTPTPFPLQDVPNTRMIAVYWGDVDTNIGGDIWYRESFNQALLLRASTEIRAVFPQQSHFNATWMFIATWYNVAHHSVPPSKRSTFQCVLVTDGIYAFVMFLYAKTEWTPAQVGFDAGDETHYYSVPKSLTEDIKDIPSMSNIGVPGKFIFRVDTATIQRATNINECSSNPCQHNGYCVDLINTYRCHCREGFEGVNCETDVNECASNPCLHAAVCHDNENDYLCTCPTGYTGRNCQIDIDECESSPCHNNATCVDRIAGWVCNCLPGYTGQHCELDIDDCHSNPCQQGGTCTDLVNKFVCTCPNDATGQLCETWMDHCASHPCLHGGTCENKHGGFNCTCAATWNGDICEYREENITEKCIDLEYTECTCTLHHIKQTRKSHKILIGSIGLAIGSVISILAYGLWMCQDTIGDNKVIPEKETVLQEKGGKQKVLAKLPKRKHIYRVNQGKKGHHDCFTDHTGFDFSKLYVDQSGNRMIPKCRHFKSEV